MFSFLFSGQLGDVKLEDLPGPEALLRPGEKLMKQDAYRVFICGRRPDVSSGRLPFHVRYFKINIGDFFYYFIIYFPY